MVVVIGVAWLFSGMGKTYDETGVKVDSSSEEIVDLSKEAAEKIAETVRVSESVTVYDGISVPSHARELNLSGRGLTGSLKAEVRLLTELRELDLSNNNFTGLPAEIGQLAKLEKLNLSNNPLTGLPQELGNLRNLQQLDLRDTQYSEHDLNIIKAGLAPSVQIFIN